MRSQDLGRVGNGYGFEQADGDQEGELVGDQTYRTESPIVHMGHDARDPPHVSIQMTWNLPDILRSIEMAREMSDLELVQDWLAGTYSNRQQAMDQPVWFIPVTLWYIPLPHLFDQGCGFFTEQINQHFPDKFYRSRVLQLLDNPLRLENYKLQNQSAWLGASQDQDRLSQLRVMDLDWLPECTLFLERQAESFHGAMGSDAACKLTPESTTVIQIEFDLTATTFTTLDRGIDQTTGKQTWGSSAGPYQYLKLSD